MKKPKYYDHFINYDKDMPNDTSLEDLEECDKYQAYLKSQKGKVIQLKTPN